MGAFLAPRCFQCHCPTSTWSTVFLLTEMEHSVSFVMMHAVQHDATDSKRAIVNAARELPISEGPRVSMRAIATRAGVGVATASRHFPEKLALIDAISSAEVRRIEEKIDKQLENFPAAPRGHVARYRSPHRQPQLCCARARRLRGSNRGGLLQRRDRADHPAAQRRAGKAVSLPHRAGTARRTLPPVLSTP